MEEALRGTDTLLIVGTAFYTALANKIVRHAIFKGLNIVEINLETSLHRLNLMKRVCSIEGSCELILPKLTE